MTNIRDQVFLTINGQGHEVSPESSFMMLADYLRYRRGLCGTKIVCAEGDCGACTVLCRRNDDPFVPINACIAIVAQLDGYDIVTVEGIKHQHELSPVQQAIVSHHGSQCGFCTPGFVMSMSALFEQPHGKLTEQRVKNCLTGNLCRCTGYQALIDAALAVDVEKIVPLHERYASKRYKDRLRYHQSFDLLVRNHDHEFFAPTTIENALNYRAHKPDALLCSGATDIGVWITKGKRSPKQFLSLKRIAELDEITEDSSGRIIVGASVNINNFRRFIKTRIPPLAEFLNIFASPQIKNMASVVGNIANASPIADTLPFFMIADAMLHLRDQTTVRILPINEAIVAYKQLALKPGEIITHVSFMPPLSSSPHHLSLTKISQRKDLDIATINMACSFSLSDGLIDHARIAVGGVFSSVLRLIATENFLHQKRLSSSVIESARSLIQQEIKPIDDLRGSQEYRRILVDQIFIKTVQELSIWTS